MIKGAGKTALGLPVLFLGLSGENVTRLAAEGSVAVAGEQPPPVDNRAQHADWHERTGT